MQSEAIWILHVYPDYQYKADFKKQHRVYLYKEEDEYGQNMTAK